MGAGRWEDGVTNKALCGPVGRGPLSPDHADSDCKPCPRCLAILGRPGCPDCHPCPACAANITHADDASPFDPDRDYIDYDPKPVAYYNDGSPYYGPPHPDDHLFAEDWDDIERAQRAARRASLAELGSGPMRPVP
jgi:hypothetical protein